MKQGASVGGDAATPTLIWKVNDLILSIRYHFAHCDVENIVIDPDIFKPTVPRS
jgi:hypothetical protein